MYIVPGSLLLNTLFLEKKENTNTWLPILIRIRLHSNGNAHECEYVNLWSKVQRLFQRKRRIQEVTQQILQTREKADACAKIWRNLKGKHVETYGDLTIMELFMPSKSLYEQSIVRKTMCYDSLSHQLQAKTYRRHIKGKFCVLVRCERWKYGLEDGMGCNTLVSWCITRFLCKLCLFAIPLMKREKCGG